MPRKPRYYAAGVPCHVITRGNDRTACFFAERSKLRVRILKSKVFARWAANVDENKMPSFGFLLETF